MSYYAGFQPHQTFYSWMVRCPQSFDERIDRQANHMSASADIQKSSVSKSGTEIVHLLQMAYTRYSVLSALAI